MERRHPQVHRIHDGSKNAPRLEIHQSWWAMSGLGTSQREWTTEEKFEKLAEAGFTGILGRLPAPEEQALWRKLLDEYQLSFGVHSFPSRREELASFLQEAKRFGVQYVNSQVMDSFVTDEAAVQLLHELTEEAAAAGLPYLVETHRGRVTQDLHRTVSYVQALPSLRLTIDLSHYVVAGEMVGESMLRQAEPLFDVLLQRTSSLHGRVSNGEQVQIDIGDQVESELTAPYLRWWSKGMAYWLQDAQPGDVLPFVSELGPPGYAITSRSHGGAATEISDRWQQAMIFKQLAEEAWRQAHTLRLASSIDS
ncbi:sugar phosphate isomerase/epimerase family protein [Paenibacillus rigui]|uniref:Xylose isomerase n=1 Tax=Paenibacillus rigui TaxID=554312 RepID=A0A229UH88_9BACL|nr:TIM barrel protein [Paenibacillus rigui]OXM82721.1 xylose isomerase [Paenibacillus rigui]